MVSVTGKVTEWLKVRKALARLAKQHVEVGVIGDGRNAEVAYFAEYGTSTIPPRGLLSRPLAQHRPEHVDALGRIVDRVARGEDGDRLLGLLGLKAVGEIKAWVAGGNAAPENTPATVARKGSSTPLIDTGELVNSLQHRVVTAGEGAP